NRNAKRLFETTPDLEVNSHDWWGYQLVSGAGGIVFYDPEPTMKYRQHGRNAVGLETTLWSRWGRVRAIFAGG
ncbi:glycosyltransferase family 2 protein, partial [Klebsiella pneumoniae]|nr:glycosyltransferase family 2 protein [Klebsiella pneumoniae]